MPLKRFVTSSVRNQLLASFLLVIVVFAIALVVAIKGVSSVSSTVRKGDGAAKLAEEVSSSARNMAGSGLMVALGLVALATGPANEAADALSTSLENYANLRQREADSNSSGTESSTLALVIALSVIAFAVALGIALLLSRGIVRGLNGVGERLGILDEHALNDLRDGLASIADGRRQLGCLAASDDAQRRDRRACRHVQRDAREDTGLGRSLWADARAAPRRAR
jgi:hypothetical protein